MTAIKTHIVGEECEGGDDDRQILLHVVVEQQGQKLVAQERRGLPWG